MVNFITSVILAIGISSNADIIYSFSNTSINYAINFCLVMSVFYVKDYIQNKYIKGFYPKQNGHE